MSSTTAGAPGPGVAALVRVTVRSDASTADLALPTTVPVAELLPEIARSLGALDPATAHRGFHLVSATGLPLAAGTGLTFQDVRDGDVLVLSQQTATSQRVYDDVVEAMADVVETTTSPWGPASARRTALAAAVGLLGLGAFSIALERPSIIAGALAGVVALVLVTAAIVLARLEDEPEVALVLAWSAAAFGAVGAFTALDRDILEGWPFAAAGGGAAAAAALGMLGLRQLRLLLLPAVVVGLSAAIAGSVAASTQFDVQEVFLTLFVVLVIVAGVLPALSLASAGGSAPQPEDPNSLPDDPDEISYGSVREGARTGHQVLLSMTVATGLLLVITAPMAVDLGLTGALVMVCAGIALMVRTRQFRAGTEVGVGLVSAAAGLLAVALSIIVERPEWRLGLIIVVTVLAAGTLVTTFVRSEASVLRGRVAEIIELAALVAMLPLFVIAVGIVSAVRS